MTPVRIQRQRTPGWRMPRRTRYVGRGTAWGNPYQLDDRIPPGDVRARVLDRVRVLVGYRRWLAEQLARDPAFLEPLRGRDLACWCPLTERCHADILLERLAATEPAT